MGRYILQRLAGFVPVVLGATFLLYAAVFVLPGDPVTALYGDRPISPSAAAVLRGRYHLNDPLLVQYGKYLAQVGSGDLGRSIRGREVTEILADTMPVTLRLTGIALVFEAAVGIAAGLVAALRRGSISDVLIRFSTVALLAVPTFVLAYALQLLLGVRLGWLPIAGLGQGWVSYLLPGLVLGASALAFVIRLTRTSVIENLTADYVRTATAKGLSRRRVVLFHVLRNSLISVVTFLGVELGALLGGAVVIEGVFNLPGVGRAVYLAIRLQDYPVVVGIVTFFVLVFLLVNLLVDVLYGLLDPRIRHA